MDVDFGWGCNLGYFWVSWHCHTAGVSQWHNIYVWQKPDNNVHNKGLCKYMYCNSMFICCIQAGGLKRILHVCHCTLAGKTKADIFHLKGQ